MHRSSVAVALALLVLIGLAPAGVAAPYGVSTNDDVSVPTQTVEIDGSSYQIDAVAEVSKGDRISASVSVDGEEDWVVDLYNDDEQIEDWAEGTGDGSVSFDTANLEPGTYALALEVDGKTQAIHPVVVSEYDLSVSAPGEITADEQLEVTVDVGQSVAADESVEVGLHKDGTELQAQATSNGDGTYTATLNPDETGDWALYAAVRADGSAGGYPVSTGIANGQVVSVTESSSGSGDDGSGDSDGGSSDDGGDSDTGGTTDDGTGDGNQTDDSDDGNETDGGAAAPPDDGNGTDTDGGNGEADGTSDETDGADESTETATNATDDGTMQPNEPVENESDAGDDELAIGWLVPLVALCLVALLGLVRSGRST